MFKRIKILSLLQMSERYKFKKVTSVKMLIAKIALRILTIGIVAGVCAALTYVLVDIMMVPKTVNLLIFIIFFTQLLSVISCVSGLLKNLYLSKDNSILLSYPAKHIEVFLSKLFVYYFYELIKNLSFLTPLFIGFGIIFKLITPMYIISVIILTIITPLFPVLIGALITIPVIYVKKFLSTYGWVKTIIIIGLMIGGFVLLDQILDKIPVPLRIVALYNSFMKNVTAFISSVNEFAIFYNNIGNILFGNDVLINYLVVFGVLIGLVLLVTAISLPLYFYLASKSSEQNKNKEKKAVNKAHKNIFFTFVRKEWLLSIRNIGEFVSDYIFIFATPYVLYTMVTIITSVDRNKLGEQMTIVFTGMIALVMASAANTASAVAITKEGSEFALLKTSPGKTSKVAWAKILFNLVSSTVVLFISFLLVTLLCDRITDLKSIWMMFGCVVLVNAGLIFWSFQIDILKPELREYATTNSIEHSKNFSQSILIGFIMSIAFGVLSLLFFLDSDNMLWVWGRIFGIATAFFIARFYLFRGFLNTYFKEIEF